MDPLRYLGDKRKVYDGSLQYNRFTSMYLAARNLAEPIDWVLCVGEDKYSSVFTELMDNDVVDVVPFLVNFFNNKYVRVTYKTNAVTYDIIRYFLVLEDEGHLSENVDDAIINCLVDLSELSRLSLVLPSREAVKLFANTNREIYDKSMETTRKRLTDMDNYFKEVMDNLPNANLYLVGEPYIVLTTLLFEFRGVKPGRGMNIFDSLVMTENLTFVHYTTEAMDNYFKVFEGDEAFGRIPLKKSMIEKPRANKPNYMEITVWLGKGSVYKTSSSSFFHAVLDLNTGRLTCKVPVRVREVETGYRDKLIEVVKSSFAFLSVPTVETLSHVAEVNFYPHVTAGFNEFSFLEQVMYDPLYKHLFYAEEAPVPFSRKRRFELFYTPMFSRYFYKSTLDPSSLPVKWSLVEKVLTGGTTDKVYSTQNKYMRVRISSARDERHIDEIVAAILNALKMHSADRDTTVYNMSSIQFPAVFGRFTKEEEVLASIKISQRGKDEEDTGLGAIPQSSIARTNNLSKRWPKVFGRGYTRDCPSPSAPECFDTMEEAMRWVKSNEHLGLADPLPFPAPPEDPLFYFAGPGAKYSYPNVTKNTDSETRGSYSYVPRCTSHDPLTEPSTSLFKVLYMGSTSTTMITKREKVSDKFLTKGEKGSAPLSLRRLFSEDNLVKLGVSSAPDPNSLIHCVMLAVSEKAYANAVDKGNAVSAFRKRIARRDNVAELVGQEMYGFSKEEILRTMSDDKVFFDPSLFFRVLEENFNVNIFVFTNEGTDYVNDSRVDIPRNRLIHCRPRYYERDSVIIFKNVGPKRVERGSDYPHCELIAMEKGDISMKRFDKKVTEMCYTFIGDTSDTATFMPKGGYFDGYNDIHSVNIGKIFGDSVVSQRMDNYGHVRSFDILYIREQLVTVFFPPTAPVLAPLTTEEPQRVTVNLATSLMGRKPHSYASLEGESVDGLWFSFMGVDEFFYIHVKATLGEVRELKKGGNSPYVRKESSSVTERVRKLKKTVNIITQLVVWVFDTYRFFLRDVVVVEDPGNLPGKSTVSFLDDNEGDDEEFIRKYFSNRYDSVSKDTEKYYDLSGVTEELKDYASPKECMEWLREVAPTLVSGLKFMFVNERFMNCLKYHVRDHFRSTMRTNVVPSDHIVGYYSSHLDFKRGRGSQVFVGRQDLREWISTKLKSNRNEIRDSVKLSYHTEREPYLVDDGRGRIVMIQNSRHLPSDSMSSLYGAMKIAEEWRERGVNLGYYAMQSGKERLDADYYYVSSEGKMMLVDDSLGEDVLEILVYAGVNDYESNCENCRYAAILRLG